VTVPAVARRGIVAALVATGVLAVGCGASTAPEVPAGPDGVQDQALVAGRDIYARRCASCHGVSGGGGRAPRLSDGEVLEAYPDAEDQIAMVADGRGGMPAFADVLDRGELEAVVRYTREVLAVQ
jgi:mono/diheme cytochrome c family protein